MEASRSCESVQRVLAHAKTKKGAGKPMLTKLTRAAAELDRQLSNATKLLEQALPGVERKVTSAAARRRLNQNAAAAIDREMASLDALAEEATGDTPAAASAARLLADREDSTHRRIQSLASRRGTAVRAKARRAKGRIRTAVYEVDRVQEERQQREESVRI